jgi:hypothetical protein
MEVLIGICAFWALVASYVFFRKGETPFLEYVYIDIWRETLCNIDEIAKRWTKVDYEESFHPPIHPKEVDRINGERVKDEFFELQDANLWMKSEEELNKNSESKYRATFSEEATKSLTDFIRKRYLDHTKPDLQKA